MSVSSARAPFIVFEGIDGSGKSTQIARLAERLRLHGKRVFVTREPSDGPVGALIRQGMAGRIDLDDRVIAALFVADRLDHLLNRVDGVVALLESGIIVLSDRYVMSSYAYHAPFVEREWIRRTNALSTDLLYPDLTVFIDVTADCAVERITASRGMTDRYESLEHLATVREHYLEAIAEDETVFVVDGSKSADDIADEVWSRICEVATTVERE